MTAASPTTSPVLTVLHLDPDHPDVRRDMTDVCRMHGRVWDLLACDPTEDKGRELWATPRPDRLLIQWRRPADPRWLPDGYALSHHTRHITTTWPAGTRLQWALIANTVKDVWTHAATPTGHRRRRISVDPTTWIRPRLAEILDIDGDTPHILDTRTVHGRKPATGTPIHLRRSHMTGTGTVLDPPALAATITTGIGKARGYGCGLLLVQPAPTAAR